MVQSVCLTSRGSGVRLPQLPPKPERAYQGKILKSYDFGIFRFRSGPTDFMHNREQDDLNGPADNFAVSRFGMIGITLVPGNIAPNGIPHPSFGESEPYSCKSVALSPEVNL